MVLKQVFDDQIYRLEILRLPPLYIIPICHHLKVCFGEKGAPRLVPILYVGDQAGGIALKGWKHLNRGREDGLVSSRTATQGRAQIRIGIVCFMGFGKLG